MKQNHHLFIDIARRVARESEAVRLKVGAVIAKDGSILDFGYNGTPPGWDSNRCEIEQDDGSLISKPEVIHAEMNAMMKCAKSGRALQGATLYLTNSPCSECAKNIIASGIVAVYYVVNYRKTDGIDILKKAKIKVVQWWS